MEKVLEAICCDKLHYKESFFYLGEMNDCWWNSEEASRAKVKCAETRFRKFLSINRKNYKACVCVECVGT